MTTKKVKGFALEDEDIRNLDEITRQTSMNNSEVIRYLIKKCLNDKTEMQIIMQNFLNTEGERVGVKRKLRIMSDKQTLKKACEAQRSQAPAVSSNCQEHNTPNDQETTRKKPSTQEQPNEDLSKQVNEMLLNLPEAKNDIQELRNHLLTKELGYWWGMAVRFSIEKKWSHDYSKLIFDTVINELKKEGKIPQTAFMGD